MFIFVLGLQYNLKVLVLEYFQKNLAQLWYACTYIHTSKRQDQLSPVMLQFVFYIIPKGDSTSPMECIWPKVNRKLLIKTISISPLAKQQNTKSIPVTLCMGFSKLLHKDQKAWSMVLMKQYCKLLQFPVCALVNALLNLPTHALSS